MGTLHCLRDADTRMMLKDDTQTLTKIMWNA